MLPYNILERAQKDLACANWAKFQLYQ